MRLTNRFSLVALAATLVGSAQADIIDAYVEAEMKRLNVPGLALLVLRDGKVIKRKGYGFADLDKKIPVTPDHTFDMGSIGKSMTATCVMKLVEQGKVKLDEPIRTYLSDVPDSWRNITVRHLLTHTSGIAEYAAIPTIGLNDAYTTERWKKLVFASKLDFEPGRMHQYSNSNFTLLGNIIETVTGKRYVEVLREFVLQPAGMENTRFRPSASVARQAATGYFFQNGKHVPAGPGGVAPIPSDGGGFTTVDDLNRFWEAFSGGNLVDRTTEKAMAARVQLPEGRRAGYGLGWMIREMENLQTIGHGGNSVGFSATLTNFPKQRLTVAMLCNLYPIGGDEFAIGLARQLYPHLQAKRLKDTTDPEPQRTERLVSVLKSLASGNTRDENLHEEARARLATARGMMALGAFAIFKDVSEPKFIDVRTDKPDTLVRYRMKVKEATWIVTFAIAPNGKVYSVSRQTDVPA
jgi:CubicO group peptidase (beta-lactamase class C family)